VQRVLVRRVSFPVTTSWVTHAHTHARRALAALAPALPLLHTLHLAVCLGLCDDALVHLVRAPSLADLNLRGCWRLSDEGG
jgi:hypothetical protein